MPDWNNFTVIGRAGNVPEKRPTANGGTMATFTLYEHQWKQGAEITATWRVVAFGRNAEREVGKGDKLLISGSLRIDDYERDGRTERRYEIVANDIVVLQRKQQAEPESDDQPW